MLKLVTKQNSNRAEEEDSDYEQEILNSIKVSLCLFIFIYELQCIKGKLMLAVKCVNVVSNMFSGKVLGQMKSSNFDFILCFIDFVCGLLLKYFY